MNAKFLFTRSSTGKIYELASLLELLRWPDIFVVTETAGAAGTEGFWWLDQSGISHRYQSFQTNRSTAKNGGAADDSRLVGAGVLLLVNRRLRAEIRAFEWSAPLDDRAKLDGHLRIWRLNPSPRSHLHPRALSNALIITAAYIPPPGQWLDLVGDAIFEAIESSEQVIREVRRAQGADHIVIGHFNAQCNNYDFNLNLADGADRLDNISSQLPLPLTRRDRPRASLSVSFDKLYLHRTTSKSAPDNDERGIRLARIMEAAGMCATSGVLRHVMPTTWVQCKRLSCFGKPGQRCVCGKARMHAVNDQCFVSADLVVDALLSSHGDDLLRLVSRRIDWTEKIDHAVTYGHFSTSLPPLPPPPPLPPIPPNSSNSSTLPASSSSSIPFSPSQSSFLPSASSSLSAASSSSDPSIRVRPKRLLVPDNKYERAAFHGRLALLLNADLISLQHSQNSSPLPPPSFLPSSSLPPPHSPHLPSLFSSQSTPPLSSLSSPSSSSRASVLERFEASLTLAVRNAHSTALKSQPPSRPEADIALNELPRPSSSSSSSLSSPNSSHPSSNSDSASSSPSLPSSSSPTHHPAGPSINQLWKARNAAKLARKSHLPSPPGITHSQANKAIRTCLLKRRRRNQLARAKLLSSSFSTAARLHWRILQKLAKDPGEPSNSSCKLMDRLNNKDGKLISTDRATITRHLIEYRQSVSCIPNNLSSESKSDALVDLVFLSKVNQSILNQAAGALASSSSCALSAGNPLSAWRGPPLLNQPEPPPAPTSLHRESTFEFASSIRELAAESLEQFNAKRARYSISCSKLEGEFTLAELSAVLANLRDVGPGLDGASPASLRHLQDQTKQIVLDHLNSFWRSGATPSTWNEIRIVLHYKGKGSDPYCADNYRGLGIGAIWEKLLSLMMMHRLEQYLLQTDALHGSQGGFLRMRGPPEQVFTLSETVRAELLRSADKRPVFLTFIDIERAYDSVLHPKLWARCAKMGIGGRFLAMLQSMYAGKRGTIDINGELVGSHDIQCGVLQGNPLSPLLFNIYLDDLLRKIDEFAARPESSFGIPLPLVAARHSPHNPGLNFATASRLCSLFFADDGVLLTRDHSSTQQLLNFIDTELSRICLPLNARKTKVMIVPPFSTDAEEYVKLKQAVEGQGDFVARGRPVEVVDEFAYLGITLWWRWDFNRAYEAALARAKRGLYQLRQAGFQNRNIPLVFQYRLVLAHVLSHLDYVAPVAGIHGYSASVAANERMLSDMLRVITCTHPKSSGDALKAESGTWQQDVRIQMLQLRFFVKLSCAPASSTHYRALVLSRLFYDCKPNRVSGRACQTTFMHCVTRSSRVFRPDPGIAVVQYCFLASCIMLLPSLPLITVERLQAGMWVCHRLGVDACADLPDQQLRLRCPSSRALAMDYSTSTRVTAWYLPAGTTFISAITDWSSSLRQACFASLRSRGNCYRQKLYSDLIINWCADDSSLRDYAPLKRASYMEPYWFSIFPSHARRLLRARTAQRWGNEFDLRRAPCHVLLLASDKRTLRRALLKRIDFCDRACYLCSQAQWMPESMSHLLLHCQHDRLLTLRSATVTQLRTLAGRIAHTIPAAPPAPDFSDDIALYCVLQLCTGIGPTQHRELGGGVYQLDVLRPMGITTRSCTADMGRIALDQRRRQWFQLFPDRMRTAVTWVSFLCNQWRVSVGNDRATTDASEAGQELVNLVCQFNQSLFAVRRHALANDVHYLTRDRDPPPIRSD